MGDSVLDEVKVAVQAKVETAGKKWRDDKWKGFVHAVALWLLNNKEHRDDVVDAAAGLIVYGATTEEKLKSVGQGDYDKFTLKLAAKGVPDAICDLLFEKYVDKSAGKKRAGSGGSEGVRPVKRRPTGEGTFFASITECEVVSDSVHKFQERIVDSSGKQLLFVRECYTPLYKDVLNLAPKHDGVIVTGTSGIGKTFLGVSAFNLFLFCFGHLADI